MTNVLVWPLSVELQCGCMRRKPFFMYFKCWKKVEDLGRKFVSTGSVYHCLSCCYPYFLDTIAICTEVTLVSGFWAIPSTLVLTGQHSQHPHCRRQGRKRQANERQGRRRRGRRRQGRRRQGRRTDYTPVFLHQRKLMSCLWFKPTKESRVGEGHTFLLTEHHIRLISPADCLVGGNHGYGQLVDVVKLGSLCGCCACHACQLLVAAEEILQANQTIVQCVSGRYSQVPNAVHPRVDWALVLTGRETRRPLGMKPQATNCMLL